jgi:hypothetical protein
MMAYGRNVSNGTGILTAAGLYWIALARMQNETLVDKYSRNWMCDVRIGGLKSASAKWSFYHSLI